MSHKSIALACLLAGVGATSLVAQNPPERASDPNPLTVPTAYHLPGRVEKLVRPIPSVNPLRFPEIQAACQDNLQGIRARSARLPGQGTNQLCPGRSNQGTPVMQETPAALNATVNR